MPVHEAEQLAEKMYQEGLIEFIRFVQSGVTDDEAMKFYKDKVWFPFHSLVSHVCSDWAEENLQNYISSTSRKRG